MSDFRFTIHLNISGRNQESAVKKLIKALYSGRTHFDRVVISPEVIREVGGLGFFGEKDIPHDLEQWQILLKEKLAQFASAKPVGKDDKRKLAADLREMADRLEN